MVPCLLLQQGTNKDPTMYNNKWGPNGTISLILTKVSTQRLILNSTLKLFIGTIFSLHISDTKKFKDTSHNSMSTYSNK